MTPISSTKIRFDFATMSWKGLTIEQMQLWEHLYPDVNVVQVLKVDMPRWLDRCVTNGTIKKVARKKDWKKTITNWLKREQIKAAWRALT